MVWAIWLKFNHAGRECVVRSPRSQGKIMSRAIKRLLTGGLIIMTMAVSTAATATGNDLKLTIVNPQNLYDPSPNATARR